jgi:hypothetical protein
MNLRETQKAIHLLEQRNTHAIPKQPWTQRDGNPIHRSMTKGHIVPRFTYTQTYSMVRRESVLPDTWGESL